MQISNLATGSRSGRNGGARTVVVVAVVVKAVKVSVAGAAGEVMKQLHAELMRPAGTVAR